MNISSTSSSSSSSTDYGRLTGLATGMDTDGLVKQAMSADQTKIDQAKQDIQYVQWQQEAYVDFINTLKDFGKNFDILQSDNMMSSTNFTGTVATSTLASGVAADNYLTATTLPGAIKGTYQVKVDQLAEGAKDQTDLGSLGFNLPSNLTNLNGKDISFKIGTSTYKITLDTNYSSSSTANDVVNDIKAKMNAIDTTLLTSKMSVGNVGGKVMFTALSNDIMSIDSATTAQGFSDYIGRNFGNTFNSSSKLSDLGLTGTDSFTIAVNGGSPFTVNIDLTTNPNKTVSQFVDDLRNTKVGDVSLSSYLDINFSDLTNKLTIQTKNTGSNNNVVISSSTSSKMLGIAGTYIGVDANLSIKAPGETDFVSVTKNSNNFSIDGVTYNLVATTGGDAINLNVKSDASAQVEKFKKFVDAYNTLIDKINTKVTEKKDYNYKPLTDAQKASMTTDQITNWETKAKEGILRRDSYLSGILTQMRQAIYNTVTGAGISITEVGITTTSNYYDGGKLTIDETKLKTALQDRGDLVQKLFTQIPDSSGNKGIFRRFQDILDKNVGNDGSLIKKAGYINTKWVSQNELSKTLVQKNTRLNDLKEMFTQKQQRLYSMYATLESNMNKLNSQSNWLSSQLGAM
ncbi:flagellar filament capping protein FliD [Clostridium manihotivorum]|uniref:Flagellar hook-associated protein 2 n=1 Tax=Clostridium manihotivorum TaxID=2320868 RepID=A0A410DRH3_9CLOT|nr:flagellar filament capping protein FliD [Clostridium manihotivorum]QAA31648.1 hypothetical protein C1I91_08315 [Clostridium manihotivorum]